MRAGSGRPSPSTSCTSEIPEELRFGETVICTAPDPPVVVNVSEYIAIPRVVIMPALTFGATSEEFT